MFLLKIIYTGIANFSYIAYLLESNHSRKIKIKIFLLYFFINFKFILWAKWFKTKKEKIFGYTVNTLDYEIIQKGIEEIFLRNEYFFTYSNPSPVIFDCGANIGFATIYLKWLYPKAIIYAFEPDPTTFKILERNIKENNFQDVHLYNTAITSKDGKIDFFVDYENPASLLKSTNPNRILTKKKITVDTSSLAKFIKKEKITKISFLKMDIEGSEIEVINDLNKNNLLSRFEQMTIEYHHLIDDRCDISSFLKIFEKVGFKYQLDSRCIPIYSRDKFQDILFSFYRS